MKKILCILCAVFIIFSVLSIYISAQDEIYEDVPEGIWYSQFVADCAAKGLMIGTSETTFSPDVTMTRAMFVQTMYNYYKANIQGTDNDLDHLGHSKDYEGGSVGTTTEIDCTNPFTLEHDATVYFPDNPDIPVDYTYRATREQLLSGTNTGLYASNIKKQGNTISFASDNNLRLVPDSSYAPCKIFISGGHCFASGYSGTAKWVSVSSDRATVEAETEKGAEFEITLCDLASRTGVIVKGKSSGNLYADLFGFDLTVKGAVGKYSVEVYEWIWHFNSGVLKSFTRAADVENSNVLPFGDVEEDAYYIEALKWAARLKLTSGISQTEFAPDAPVTREQIATFLERFRIKYHLRYVNTDYSYNFVDESKISDYAKDSVQKVAKSGLMVGDNYGKFNPVSAARRCEVATVFSKLDSVVKVFDKNSYFEN